MADDGNAAVSPASSDDVLANIMAYRNLSRGVCPPASIWLRSGAALEAPQSMQPPMSSSELRSAQQNEDKQLFERLNARQQELRAVPTDLPMQIRVPLAIERALPALLPGQRAMREVVMGYADRTRLLDDAAASLSLRRARRVRQPREFREAERSERKRAAEMVRVHTVPLERRPLSLTRLRACSRCVCQVCPA